MKVQVELDLGDVVGSRPYGEDGEAPITLLDAIVEQAAAQLRAKIGDDVKSNLRRRTQQITDEEIRAQVTPLVAKILENPVAPQLSGPPVPLAEHIADIVRKELADTTRSGSYDHRETVLSKLLKEEVQRALGSELRDEVTAAKGRVLGAMKDKAAEIIAETIERSAAGRL